MLTEHEQALLGPREMKPHGSREWCLQTIYLLKRRWDRLEYTEAEWSQTLKELEDVRAWEVLDYPDEDAMLRKEIGRTRKQSLEDVRLRQHGGDHKSKAFQEEREDQGNNITLIRGTSASYTLARLRRDRPDLAEQVDSGVLSTNAAAIEAGFRQRTLSIPSDPAGAARAILRHFSPEQIDEIVAVLQDAL